MVLLQVDLRLESPTMRNSSWNQDCAHSPFVFCHQRCWVLKQRLHHHKLVVWDDEVSADMKETWIIQQTGRIGVKGYVNRTAWNTLNSVFMKLQHSVVQLTLRLCTGRERCRCRPEKTSSVRASRAAESTVLLVCFLGTTRRG